MITSQLLLEYVQNCDEDDENEKPTSAEDKESMCGKQLERIVTDNYQNYGAY